MFVFHILNGTFWSTLILWFDVKRMFPLTVHTPKKIPWHIILWAHSLDSFAINRRGAHPSENSEGCRFFFGSVYIYIYIFFCKNCQATKNSSIFEDLWGVFFVKPRCFYQKKSSPRRACAINALTQIGSDTDRTVEKCKRREGVLGVQKTPWDMNFFSEFRAPENVGSILPVDNCSQRWGSNQWFRRVRIVTLPSKISKTKFVRFEASKIWSRFNGSTRWITPLLGVITPVSLIYKAICRGYIELHL